MIFMAKVCPKAINFATAESIHQLLALRPHPSGDVMQLRENFLKADVLEYVVVGLGKSPNKKYFCVHLNHQYSSSAWSIHLQMTIRLSRKRGKC